MKFPSGIKVSLLLNKDQLNVNWLCKKYEYVIKKKFILFPNLLARKVCTICMNDIFNIHSEKHER